MRYDIMQAEPVPGGGMFHRKVGEIQIPLGDPPLTTDEADELVLEFAEKRGCDTAAIFIQRRTDMARISKANGNDVSEGFYDELDYCASCYAQAVRDCGPEDEIDQDHPPYMETDYRCEACDAALTEEDE
jgi:hypothetical protein